MKSDSMVKTAKIIAEVRNRTGIDEVDAEALEKLLKDELHEYCRMLDEYYMEGYHNAIYRARSIAYDSGYDDGHSAGHSKSHSAV